MNQENIKQKPKIVCIVSGVGADIATSNVYSSIRISEKHKKTLGLPNFGNVCLVHKSKSVAGSVQFAEDLDLNYVDISKDLHETLEIFHGDLLEILPIYPFDIVSVADIDVTLIEKPKDRITKDVLVGCLMYKPIILNSILWVKSNKFKVVRINPFGLKYYLITPSTNLTILDGLTPKKQQDKGFAIIGGLKKTLAQIKKLIDYPFKYRHLYEQAGLTPFKGILLYGPPGTGKTTLAKAIAAETKSNFYAISAPEIASKFFGDSEKKLRMLFQKAEEHQPSIIFIDEIEAIAPKRDKITGEVEKRIVAQLLSLLDGIKPRGQVIVIGATNLQDSVDEALRRPGRFDKEIEIKPPNPEERKEMLEIFLKKAPLGDDIDLESIADQTNGFVGADLKALCTEVGTAAIKQYAEKKRERFIILNQDFKYALTQLQPSSLRQFLFERPNVKWQDIGGLDEIITEIKYELELPLKFGKLYDKYKFKQIRGVLLYGPPGTGKTMIAKAIATELKFNFISIKGPELLSKYVGETEDAIRTIFKKAKSAEPSIIFIDEIDTLCSSRQTENFTANSGNTVGQILTQMDGLVNLKNVIVIGTTNRPDLLDKALLRPGRFDKIINIGYPTQQQLTAIFKLQLSKIDNDLNDFKLEELTYKAFNEKFTGADITLAIRDAFQAILKTVENVNIGNIFLTYSQLCISVDGVISSKRKSLLGQLESDVHNRYS